MIRYVILRVMLSDCFELRLKLQALVALTQTDEMWLGLILSSLFQMIQSRVMSLVLMGVDHGDLSD